MHRLYHALQSREGAGAALLVSLATLLIAGLHNVAHGFAAVKPGASSWVHWGSAAAVELGVAAIALTIAVSGAAGRRNLRLYAGVLLFVGASLFANYDASLEALADREVTWRTVTRMDPWRLAKAGLLGGAIPLMVLVVIESLRELATLDAGQQPVSSSVTGAGRPDGAALSSARDYPRLNGTGLKDPTGEKGEMRRLIADAPTIDASELASRFHISRATVYRWGHEIGAQRLDGRWILDKGS